MTDRPGRELPKDYRQVADELVEKQGWRYRWTGRHGHPQLIPPDPDQPILVIPTTPTSRSTAFRNFVAAVRQRGGKWPS